MPRVVKIGNQKAQCRFQKKSPKQEIHTAAIKRGKRNRIPVSTRPNSTMATVSITNDLLPYLASLRSYLARENKEALHNPGSTTQDGTETDRGSDVQEDREIRIKKEQAERGYIECEKLKAFQALSSQRRGQPLKRLRRVSPSSSKKHYSTRS